MMVLMRAPLEKKVNIMRRENVIQIKLRQGFILKYSLQNSTIPVKIPTTLSMLTNHRNTTMNMVNILILVL